MSTWPPNKTDLSRLESLMLSSERPRGGSIATASELNEWRSASKANSRMVAANHSATCICRQRSFVYDEKYTRHERPRGGSIATASELNEWRSASKANSRMVAANHSATCICRQRSFVYDEKYTRQCLENVCCLRDLFVIEKRVDWWWYMRYTTLELH
ncbi:hypothetical protein Ae201684_000731 [Aphanomyces euteiches]|uniref:Uncharacterized protein n=1 Tax=Aphanomyces euteiches TaxID=100861 RepID=A0A6G0XWA0_9STRA|nr:hypothetical protein Ae201684_000731 [Aphanomyces euteiches]